MNVEGAKCKDGHTLELVAEGYAYCTRKNLFDEDVWYPWRFTPPVVRLGAWKSFAVLGRGGEFIPAWVAPQPMYSKQEALDFINADIAAHRALPFDEERERSRLIAV